jgi:RNA polymerase sigma factor (sigma-70 family)
MMDIATNALASGAVAPYLDEQDGRTGREMERGEGMTADVPPKADDGAEEHDEAQEAPVVHTPLPDNEFKQQLAQVIPHLRAFGRSLSGNRDLADDLVQETLLKAWAARQRFQAGTNMRAWTFIILRNLFLSQMRRARFKGEWDEITASKLLAAPASQDRHVELGDMQRALLHLPQPQREALILVGAGGFAYEEAAEICGCAVGTIKSRVARGRVALEALLSEGKLPSRRTHKTDVNTTALQTIMDQVDELSKDTSRG